MKTNFHGNVKQNSACYRFIKYHRINLYRKVECEKLAVVYFKLTNDAPSPYTFGTRKQSAAGMAANDEGTQRRRYLAPGRPRERQLSESQKLSESLALEKGMLSRLHFVGIVPVP